MSRRNPKVRLLHMRDYAQRALAMVEGQTREDLDDDEKLQLALTRLVELIGEAASQVSVEVQARHPEIPWPQVIGMRHRLIHGVRFRGLRHFVEHHHLKICPDLSKRWTEFSIKT